ncbi:MAG TPA: hypothetical protein ENK55_00445 [Actinobacteria bacterium]|nr:hypothetical protein [Actinomycetota bacterium]
MTFVALEVDGRAGAVEVPIGPSGTSKIVVSDQRSFRVGPTPEWTVGLGRYIYVYIGRQDWGWFTGLALPTLSVVVWSALGAASGALGGAVCGLVAVGLRYAIHRYAKPKPGYCMELRFNYAGLLSGVKYVRRSC